MKTRCLKSVVLLTVKSWFLSSRLSDRYESLLRILRYFMRSLKSRSLLIKAFEYRVRSKINLTPALATFDLILLKLVVDFFQFYDWSNVRLNMITV